MARLAALGVFIEGFLLVAVALSMAAIIFTAMMVAVQLGVFEAGHIPVWLSSPPWLVPAGLGYGMSLLDLTRDSPGRAVLHRDALRQPVQSDHGNSATRLPRGRCNPRHRHCRRRSPARPTPGSGTR